MNSPGNSALRDPLSGAPPVRPGLEIDLTAAIITVSADQPLILTTPPETADDEAANSGGLPSGPFNPLAHRTLEIGLRSWVAEQTGFEFGYVEQLYSFGDRGRHARPGDSSPHVVSIGYLALTQLRDGGAPTHGSGRWRNWYGLLPWEDMRGGRPAVLDTVILPALNNWAKQVPSAGEGPRPLGRAERVRLLFGTDGISWDEEKVLERYECLYEAGLMGEAARDGRPSTLRDSRPPQLGSTMPFDHRRIAATAMGRLRAKLKYRPVVFELMADEFTLTALQRTVEAISGKHLHKQNFRRLVDHAALVEPTGEVTSRTGGRPAALYRFRREVTRERPAPGLKLSVARQV